MSLLTELRRRRLFRVAALYIVGAWMVLQVFDLLFPRLGVSDAVMDLAFIGALLGFPVALVFGWIYDITPRGIVRTRSASGSEDYADLSLKRTDYFILTALLLVVAVIFFNLAKEVAELPPEVDVPLAAIETPENSIAVLPFANMSSNPDNEFFCDGISEEILNKLAAMGDLHVIARTSSFALKNSGYDIRKMAATLGVRYILQGSVRRDGNQLRISTQLLDNQGQQLWNTSFDRKMEGIFAIQRDIADSVAETITPQIVLKSDVGHTPLIEAYEHYLRGHEIWMRRLLSYQWRAAEQFQNAIDLDPEFAAPYAELATMQILSAHWENDFLEYYARAQENIDKALQLNPNLATAYAAQGLLLTMQEPPDNTRAEAVLRQALDIDANLVNARNWLSSIMQMQGRRDESDEQNELALRTDPLAPVINLNMSFKEIDQGNFKQAEQRLLRLMQVPRPSNMAYLGLRKLYRLTGRLLDFHRLSQQTAVIFARQDGQPWVRPLADSYTCLGLWQQAAYWYEYLETEYAKGYQFQLLRLHLQQRQGRFEEMRAHFERVMNAENLTVFDLPVRDKMLYGTVLAMAGYFAESISVLEQVLDFEAEGKSGPSVSQNEYQALAWAYMNAGDRNKADEIIDILEEYFLHQQSMGLLYDSGRFFSFAQNAQLAGNTALALDRLQAAIDLGWRDYFALLHDPRWDSARDQLRFIEIMDWLKADIDAQRMAVEQFEAENDFQASLEQAVVDYQAREAMN
jgi:TolB-like protein